ncbi:MAG: DNA-3-methyladenine glycosylase I [Endozoicomonas sp.]
MKPENFQALYERACERKGGEDRLEALLVKPLDSKRLEALGDDRYLAEFTRKVFQSGFVWRVVDQKWPEFEQLFWQFDIERLLMMPDDMLERKAADPRIIRHLKKVWSIRENALMIHDLQVEQGRFSWWLAQWPVENIVGLWLYLKKNGSRLGGNTGPYALRAIGKDTFLLTRDVEAYLRHWKIIDSGKGTKKALMQAQTFFNDLQQHSGRSLAELSRLVALSSGVNRIGSEADADYV